MNKTLKLVFKDTQGKKNVLSIRHPKEGLTREVVENAMNDICAAAVYEKNGEMLFVEPAGAHYYSATSDSIFTVED